MCAAALAAESVFCSVMRPPFPAAASFAVFMTLCLAAAAYRIAGRPLREMADIARAMAAGDFSPAPAARSDDEIGDLARALDAVSRELKSKSFIVGHEGAKFDAVLSSMFEGIIVTDARGRILLMNPSIRKFFLVDAAPEGKRPLEILRNTAVQDMVDRLLEGKQRLIRDEIRINRPQELVFQINGVPVMRGRDLGGVILVFHDITEVRRLEKIRQDFVANVSHELRTPIASIKGYAETLLEGALENITERREFVNIIYQDSNRLAFLIDDLLDLARIESGMMTMEFAAVDLEPLVLRTIGILDKTIREKKLSLRVDIPGGLPQVAADEKRLSQVLLNLLDNAVKYTPDGGAVTVRAAVKERFVQIDVVDTGIGIPEKDLPRIFERFYRVDKGRSRELGGTGLGLSIVKHIVLAHGGDVWVESLLAQGSTFCFTLPQA